MALPDAQCLSLYEHGLARHPIDRALLLAAAADRPEGLGSDPARDWADAPLGERDARLIALRCDWFGPHFEAVATCPACREQLSLSLNLHTLAGSREEAAAAVGGIAAAAAADAPAALTALASLATDGTVQVGSARFRRPTSRDLAAVVSTSSRGDEAANMGMGRGKGSGPSFDKGGERVKVNGLAAEPEDEAAAVGRALLRRLALDAEPEGGWTEADTSAVEQALDRADPLAHVTVGAVCAACSHQWPASLDIAACLWDELVAQARMLVQQVHLLASAYGWSEDQILSMPAARRALYLQQVLA